MEPSPIRKIFEMAQNMEDIINFSLGEPNFVTPENAIQAAVESLKNGETHYTPNAGLPELKKAVAENLRDYDRINYHSESEIIVTSGGMEALMLALLTLVDPGEEVLLANPSYTNYRDQICICKGVPKYIPVYEADGFNFTKERLEQAVSSRSKVILINTPANPTGGVASRVLLEQIAEVAVKYDLYVIFDEVYKYLLYDEENFFNIANAPGMRERTLVIDSFSKSYAMTGWRAGYIAGPEAIVSKIPKIHENIVSCIPAFVQRAAAEALKHGRAAVQKMGEQYRRHREIIWKGINQIEGLSCIKPAGAFYVFVNIRQTGLSSEEFVLRLLKEGHVAAAPGSAFGSEGEGFVRMCYAASEKDIREGLRRIEKFMKDLKREKVQKKNADYKSK